MITVVLVPVKVGHHERHRESCKADFDAAVEEVEREKQQRDLAAK